MINNGENYFEGSQEPVHFCGITWDLISLFVVVSYIRP